MNSHALLVVENDIYCLWLFTLSDLKTIVAPKTAFGIFNALCASVHGLPPQRHTAILSRLPLVLFWTWINLLPFSIDNQRQTEAIKEDSINKPWRPMPAGKMSQLRAKIWMFALYPVAIISSFHLGGIRQCLCLLFLGFCYNDLGGADRNPFLRNLINSCGFISYASGAMEVAYGSWVPLSPDCLLFIWLGIIGAVVLTTVHLQDMYDQAGDKLRARQTAPLVIGDWPSRISIAIPMAIWSFLGPWYWELKIWAYVLPIGLGYVVLLRTLFLRKVVDDKRTFLLWNLWLVAFYTLPMYS